jgi:hypothetical protein
MCEVHKSDDVAQKSMPVEDPVAELNSLWRALAPSHELSVENAAQLHRYSLRFDHAIVKLAVANAIDYYLYSRKETVDFTVQKIGGICYSLRLEEENPELALFRRLCFIIRKRLKIAPMDEIYQEPGDKECDEIIELLELAQRRGVPLKELEIAARTSKSIGHFNTAVIEHVRQALDRQTRPDLIVQVNIVNNT